MIEQQTYSFDSPEGRRRANRMFEFKIMARQKMNRNCLAAIEGFLADQGISLPKYKSQYRQQKDTLLQYRTHEGEAESMEPAFGRLISMYYTIKDSGYSLGAAFMDREGRVETQTVVHACSRAKLDQVWNLRKEQIVRRTYQTWLAKGMADGWLYNYTPVHIMLTVPHQGGIYKEKRFYGDEILSDFNLVRKNPLWLAMVHGGEYGLETKRGRKDNGLHIHVHSFTLLNSHYDYRVLAKASREDLLWLIWQADLRSRERVFDSEEAVALYFEEHKRKELSKIVWDTYRGRAVTVGEFQNVLYRLWERQTGGFKIWVERLYRFKKYPKEAGQSKAAWVTEYVKPKGWDTSARETEINIGAPFPELKLQRKKFYINQDSPVEDWTAGILECIKYHFKGDTFYDAKTREWDVLLMMEVLNNTVNKRFYGRFGAFYRTPELSFNFGQEDQAEGVLPEASETRLGELMKYYRADLIEMILKLSPKADAARLARTRKRRLCEILAALESGRADKAETRIATETDAEVLAAYPFEDLLALLRTYRPGFKPKEGETTAADLARIISEIYMQRVATGMDFDTPPVEEPTDESPKARRVLENLLDPFTLTAPDPDGWDYCIFHPADRSHRSRYAQENDHASVERDLGKFLFISKKTSLKSIIRAIMTNRISEITQKDATAAQSNLYRDQLFQLDGELNRLGYYADYLFSWRPVAVAWEEYDRMGPLLKMGHMVRAKIEYLNSKGVGVKELKSGELSFDAANLFATAVTVEEIPIPDNFARYQQIADAEKKALKEQQKVKPGQLPPTDPDDLPF